MPTGVYPRTETQKEKLRKQGFLKGCCQSPLKDVKGLQSWHNISGLMKKGGKRTLESRIKQGNSIRGEKCHLWKGGISKAYKSERELAMQTIEYKLWRNAVFERDGWTCIGCGQKGGILQADHIKPWKLYPELRYKVSNGRTLCKECHKNLGWNLFKERNPRKVEA